MSSINNTENAFPETALFGQTDSIIECSSADSYPDSDFYRNDSGYSSEDSDDSERWRNRRNPETFKPFPLDCLPPAFRRYVTEKARSLNQNPAGLAMVLLSQAGAHIGAAVRLRLNGMGWGAVPILWTALIGLSGSGKSPVLSSGIGLVKEREGRLYEQYQSDLKDYQIAKKDYERFTKKERDDDEEPEEPPEEPKRRKIFITGGTIEGVQNDCQNNPKGLFLLYDELTALFSDTARGKQGATAGEWLSGYNGATVNTARKMASQVFIKNAYWSIVGGITPESFYSILGKENRKTDGTLSRFLLIWPPEAETMSFDDVLGEAESAVKAIFGKLIDISYKSEADKTIIQFDEQSAGAWNQWRQEVFNQKQGLNTDVETSLVSKSEELLARIAIILHVLKAAEKSVCSAPVEWTPGENYEQETPLAIPPVLGYDIFQAAETITRWAIQETMECYRRFGFIQPPKDESKEVLECIQNSGPLTIRDIGRKINRYRNPDGQAKLIPLLENLERAGKISKTKSRAANGAVSERYVLL